ncbi:uncharacterized protein [Periplaneta americana]|uniref:uncharacterized protein n=1 Tax=Periplaneta americana TaxID=6978 RepID=UPI0037E7D8B9
MEQEEVGPGPYPRQRRKGVTSPNIILRYLKRSNLPTEESSYGKMVCSFLFLRGINKTSKFHLAANTESIGVLGDVVFTYTHKESQESKTYFIQILHGVQQIQGSEHELLPKRELSLRKCFSSYLSIQKLYLTMETSERELFGWKEENFRYGVYMSNDANYSTPITSSSSNGSVVSSGKTIDDIITFTADSGIATMLNDLETYSSLVQELKLRFPEGCEESCTPKQEIKEFMKSCKTDVLVFNMSTLLKGFSPSDLDFLSEDYEDFDGSPSYENFLRKFRLFTSQASENGLVELMEKEMKDAFSASEYVAKEIVNEVINEISKWWDEGDYYLTEKSSFWLDILRKREHRVESLSAEKRDELEKLWIKFSYDELVDFGAFLINNITINVLADRYCTLLSCLKFDQVMKRFHNGRCIIVNIKTFENSYNEITSVWPSCWCTSLIVEWGWDYDGDDQNAWKLIKKALEIQKTYNELHNPDCIPSEEDLLKELSGELKFNGRCIFILISCTAASGKLFPLRLQDTCTLEYLCQESRDEIMSREIVFQGKKIHLSELVDSPAAVDTPMIQSILTENIEIGNIYEGVYPYVIRSLLQCAFVSKEIFQIRNKRIILAVSGVDVRKIALLAWHDDPIIEITKHDMFIDSKKRQKIIVINTPQPRKYFKKIRQQFGNIHRLKMHKGRLVLEESQGDMNLVRDHVIKKLKCLYNPGSLTDMPNGTVLLVGEAGDGKSTFLTHLIRNTAIEFPRYWIIRVNLSDCVQNLAEKKNPFDILSRCANADDSWLGKGLLRHSLREKGNVIVVVDGLDEVCYSYMKEVTTLIQYIQSRKVKKLWVASRPIWRSYLEDLLCVLPCVLDDFSTNHQKIFLSSFWRERYPMVHKDFLIISTQKITEMVITPQVGKDELIIGIPLQTNMLADVFESHDPSDFTQLPQEQKMIAYFEVYVEKKWELVKINYSEVYENTNNVELYNIFTKDHMCAAMFDLFLEKELMTLRNSDVLTTYEHFAMKFERLGDTGIILDIIGGRPRFVHRSVSEYFAAKWFCSNFVGNKEFLQRKMFDPSLQVMRNMFEDIMARNHPLHEAVLSRDILKVDKLLQEDVPINCQDCGGRTALHYVSSRLNCLCDDEHVGLLCRIGDLLVARKADEFIEDKVLGWTPLRFAEETGSWYVVEMLLNKNCGTADLVRLKDDAEFRRRALVVSLECGYIKLVDFLLRTSEEVNALITSPKYKTNLFTPLHIAAKFGHAELVDSLLDRNADMNIVDSEGRSPLMVAAENDQSLVVSQMLERNQSWLPFVPVAGIGCTNLVNSQDSWGDTALHLACRNGWSLIMKYLIKKGANPVAPNHFGDTPLHAAAETGCMSAVEFLVSEGVDVNITNIHGDTPMHIAARVGAEDVVECLLPKADVFIRNSAGHTAFELAIKWSEFTAMDIMKTFSLENLEI